MTETPVKLLSIAGALAAAVACSAGGTNTIDKPKGAKADAAEKLCQQAGEPDDCDVCDLMEWYDDGECDDFCSTPDPDCAQEREPNLACDIRLDQWMYDCLQYNLGAGESLSDAIDFCVGGVEDGEPIAIEEICDEDDEDCFIDLADNAQECADAIGVEVSGRQPNPACDERLDEWMYDCLEYNLDKGESLEDAVDECLGQVYDGEPIELAGICESEDIDCFIDLADNAEDCASAIGDELN